MLFPGVHLAQPGTVSVTSALSNELYAGIGRWAELSRTQGGSHVTRHVNRVIDGSPESHQILVRALGDPFDDTRGSRGRRDAASTSRQST